MYVNREPIRFKIICHKLSRSHQVWIQNSTLYLLKTYSALPTGIFPLTLLVSIR